MGDNKKETKTEITEIEEDKGEKPDDTDDNKKETKTEITEIEEDKEMCPDIKKWLLGGSLENNCAYTSSGCPRCFGKTHRCSFDYKKKGCDKKTITNKKDAVQELVDMKLISKENNKKTWKIHCTVVKKKGEIRLQKQLQKSKKARMTHRTKLLEKKKKRKKQNSSQRKLNRNRPQKTKKKKLKKQLSLINRMLKKKKIKAYQDKKKEDRDRKEQGEKEKQQNRKRESEKRNLDFQKRMKIKEEKKKEKEDGDRRRKTRRHGR